MTEKILVVDDSKLVTDIVRMRLEMFGYEVRLAHSGEEALEKIAQDVPDLMVLDVQNGVVAEAARRDDVIANINAVVTRAWAAGAPVVWVQHHSEQLPEGSEQWQYVPELQQSAFGDATVRQLLDMTTSVDYNEDYADEDSPVWNLGRAAGWFEP